MPRGKSWMEPEVLEKPVKTKTGGKSLVYVYEYKRVGGCKMGESRILKQEETGTRGSS